MSAETDDLSELEAFLSHPEEHPAPGPHRHPALQRAVLEHCITFMATNIRGIIEQDFLFRLQKCHLKFFLLQSSRGT
jgi:hypothetical protein